MIPSGVARVKELVAAFERRTGERYLPRRETLVSLGWDEPRIEGRQVTARGRGRGQAEALCARSRRPKGRGMTETTDLSTLFPAREAIPADVWRPPDDVGLTLLIDGQARRWAGASEPIRSAVCVREADGRLGQLELGPGALASAVEAREAVEAAARAWAGGRGEWPRASTGERIACMLDFVRRARPLREPVARARSCGRSASPGLTA
jgi:hypothetical protein